MRYARITILIGALAALAAVPAACGGGGGGGTDAKDTRSDLVLVDVSVGSTAGVPLNEIIVFEFTETLKPESIRPDTIRIRQGPNYGRQVPGSYRVDGNRVHFFPRLPVLPDISDAGIQPGTDYRITLPGIPKVATVRSVEDDRLRREQVESFQSADACGDLFTDNFLDPGPPHVAHSNPPDGAVDVSPDAELTLTFNRRPLHPATVNSANIHLTLVERGGVVFERPVQGRPVITQSHESVQVVWTPDFPLADDATYRLTVERRTQDLLGTDVEPFVAEFKTSDEPPRPGEVVIDFNAAERALLMDDDVSTASWDDAKPGELSALFTVAGGDGTAGDLKPTADQDLTPDDFQRGATVQTIDGVEVDVYNFRSIEVPEGVTVRFSQRPGGPNRPIALLSLRDIRIDGVLNVQGGRGEDGETNSRSSSIPQASGGVAGPGGTDGADNYTGNRHRDAPPQGADDVLFGAGGGDGGTASGDSSISYSGGGGGGGSRESGGAGTGGGYNLRTNWNGKGGAGGESAADRGFPVNLERRPNVGAAGGAAGGLGYYFPTSTNWRHGAGAGGGGGGAITIQGAGDVVIGSLGRINAAGGNGGSTTRNSFYYGGAGGGGGGGSVLVRATRRVLMEAGASLDVAGGTGGIYAGTFGTYKGGEGGEGGDGYIRIEASEDENTPGRPVIEGLSQGQLTYDPVSQGVFSPRGGGAPSLGQTRWVNLGVFDPEMVRPASDDVSSTLFNDAMSIEVQMAAENTGELGTPDLSGLDLLDLDGDGDRDDTLDPSSLSEWVPLKDIESLNGRGYQFFRVRVSFQLDSNHGPADPLPSLDRLRVPFMF
jgi:hypothetical protein